jgi:hypothetical protein
MFFSRGAPSIDTVIPAIDHLDEVLMSASMDDDHSPAVRAGFNIGKRTLNRYYKLTDESENYRIAISKRSIILHTQF